MNDQEPPQVVHASSSPPDWYAGYLRDSMSPPRNRRVALAEERTNTVWKAGTTSMYYTNIVSQPRWWAGVVQLNGRQMWACKHHHDEQWQAVSCARERLSKSF